MLTRAQPRMVGSGRLSGLQVRFLPNIYNSATTLKRIPTKMVIDRSSRVIPCIFPNGKSTPLDAAGEVLKKRSLGPYILTEHLYPNQVVLPKHVHRHAFLTFVIEGTFREHCGTRSSTLRTGALRFLPAGEVHENEFESQARCLHVWIDPV